MKTYVVTAHMFPPELCVVAKPSQFQRWPRENEVEVQLSCLKMNETDEITSSQGKKACLDWDSNIS